MFERQEDYLTKEIYRLQPHSLEKNAAVLNSCGAWTGRDSEGFNLVLGERPFLQHGTATRDLAAGTETLVSFVRSAIIRNAGLQASQPACKLAGKQVRFK